MADDHQHYEEEEEEESSEYETGEDSSEYETDEEDDDDEPKLKYQRSPPLKHTESTEKPSKISSHLLSSQAWIRSCRPTQGR